MRTIISLLTATLSICLVAPGQARALQYECRFVIPLDEAQPANCSGPAIGEDGNYAEITVTLQTSLIRRRRVTRFEMEAEFFPFLDSSGDFLCRNGHITMQSGRVRIVDRPRIKRAVQGRSGPLKLLIRKPLDESVDAKLVTNRGTLQYSACSGCAEVLEGTCNKL